MPQENMCKAFVYLKSGSRLEVLVGGERKFDATSFSDKVLQVFQDEQFNYFVQGSNIDYVVVQRPKS